MSLGAHQESPTVLLLLQVKLLEHNVRFGDPECQGLMMRLNSDLLEALLMACDGKLGEVRAFADMVSDCSYLCCDNMASRVTVFAVVVAATAVCSIGFTSDLKVLG